MRLYAVTNSVWLCWSGRSGRSGNGRVGVCVPVLDCVGLCWSATHAPSRQRGHPIQIPSMASGPYPESGAGYAQRQMLQRIVTCEMGGRPMMLMVPCFCNFVMLVQWSCFSSCPWSCIRSGLLRNVQGRLGDAAQSYCSKFNARSLCVESVMAWMAWMAWNWIPSESGEGPTEWTPAT